MPNPVGTFNGRTLLTDKTLRQINGLKVTFADGSWVDMGNGDKFVRGNDDIQIIPPFTDEDVTAAQPFTAEPKKFLARSLLVKNVPNAAVVVEPHSATHIEVNLTGRKASVEMIDVDQTGNTVTIGGPQSRGGGTRISGSNIQISGSGAFISVGGVSAGNISIGRGNQLTVSGLGGEPEVTITVKVPQGTSVSLDGEWLSAIVGDIEGDLVVNAQGAGDVSAGRVKNVQLLTMGSADIDVKYVEGDVTLKTMGSGDIDIRGGKIVDLNAKTMGSGDIDVAAEAQDAVLISMGSGDISVSKVKNRPSIRESGSGEVEVSNWR